MRFTTTDGKEHLIPEMCSCCQLNTAGKHEWNCPNNPDKFIGIITDEEAKEMKVKLKKFKVALNEAFDKKLKAMIERFNQKSNKKGGKK